MPKRDYIPVAIKRQVIARAESRYEYCQSPLNYAAQSFEFEHIFPKSLGGKPTLDNLALACGGCNRHEYNGIESFDPMGESSVALFHPRPQKWLDHFRWSRDYTHVIGLTPVGRASVEALKLNRPGVINLRRLLRMVGEHPPLGRKE